MLDQYRKQYLNKSIQFIFVDEKGVVQESDQVLFEVKPGSSIFEFHPFFESLAAIFESVEEEINFNCVHLSLDKDVLVIDFKMIKKDSGLLLIINDLTEHYNEYQNIAQSRNESIISEELVVLKNSELEERERFKNTFIQNFSHELRNPLTSIISIAKIISDTELDGGQKKMLNYLMDSSANLKLLLNDVLSISMISSGRLKLDNKTFNLNQLLDLLEFTYKAKAKEKGLTFSLNKSPKIPEFVEGDRLRIFQVLTNLLDNAIKYSESGKVSLQLLFNQKRANTISIRFQVTDTGSGIPEESLAVIFASFSRLKTAEKQSGAGLGLSIVDGLLALMGSKIKVDSTLGEGSKFYFDLVLKYPLQLASKTLLKVADKKKAKIKKPKDGKRFKLLLVEDDLSIQTVVFKFLMNTKHFYVDFIDDGDAVISKIVNEKFDIILMDVKLPNMDGDEITRQIRNFPFKNINDIPIVGITANAYEENITSYLKAGMNAVLSKPFEEEMLVETLYKFIK